MGTLTELLMAAPMVVCLGFVFVGGCVVGSFLNVLIARLPYEKSVVWPGSRCFHCLQPIRLLDNLPLIGYLRLRGRCRRCGAGFSSRYLWVELGTGAALLGLFVLEILFNWFDMPGLRGVDRVIRAMLLPPPPAVGVFLFHGCLLSLLIAAAVIDAEHRIIPPQITYPGALVGIIGSTAFAWPWPSGPAVPAQIPANVAWFLPQAGEFIPVGATVWPFAGPPPDWAPPGSWQLGLLNGLVGAAAGTFVVRGIKFLFEVGLGREAMGMGDADLLMMAGAFLGWQVAVLGFFVGAFAALLLKLPVILWEVVRRRPVGRELPFGPGLAVGLVWTWLSWPRVADGLRILFDPVILGLTAGIVGGGLLAAGLMLRRPAPAAAG